MRRFLLAMLYLIPSLCWSQTDAARCTLATFASDGVNFKDVVWENDAIEDVAYCKISGDIERRVSEVDQQAYAIGFEMRLPSQWNQRFLFQGNGGNDGRVVPATGASANHPVSALQQGFAVISTDAGHQTNSLLSGASFGFDPLARLNYGYRANQLLTPIAKQMIQAFYGRAPRYSYFKGCSNGGRHAMVAASRLSAEFDGFLAGNPGFNLPKAALQHAWDIQTLSALNDDIAQSLSRESLDKLASGVLKACDTLDGIEDGMVQAVAQCQSVFTLQRLQCANNQLDDCLDQQTVDAISKLFNGPVNAEGEQLYSTWAYDTGINAADWRRWKITSPIANLPMIATLGAGSLANIFTTPPTKVEASPQALVKYLRNFDFETDAPKIYATTERYQSSPMEFMTPPQAEQLSDLVENAGKLIVYHGASDGVFSVQDTMRWYDTLNRNHDGEVDTFAKLYVVPGMNHCAGGPATDQFDMLSALVNWVEEGNEPTAITARVNPANPELPATWSKQRSRPLCPYPQVAVYQQGDKNIAASFSCGAL